MAETSEVVANKATSESFASSLTGLLGRVGLPLLVYVFATVVTNSYFMGDTADYADSVVARSTGRLYYFWEFGHLLWRPLGFVVFSIFRPLTVYFVGDDPRLQATLILLALSWLAGLMTVLCLHGLLRQFCRQKSVVIISTIALVFALSFLNYFQSGAPYIPGMSFVVLALYVLNTGSAETKQGLFRPILAACALAFGICLWFPYVVVSPAVVLSPCFLLGFVRRRVIISIGTLALAGVITLCAYGGVALHIGANTPKAFKAWMDVTSGAAAETHNKGITRAIFGFARSFISMGNDGMMFKRYLIRDPFNQVTLTDLVWSSFWKILAFYLFQLAIVIGLLSSHFGRRVLGLLLVAAVPSLGFAVYWQGGDPERYLALFPFIFIAMAVCLDRATRPVIVKYVIVLFIVVASAYNLVVLSSIRLNRQQEMSAARVRPLLPNLNSRSVVLTANWQDDLVNFSRTFPFNAINQNPNLRIGSIITPGAADVGEWRQSFRKTAESVWNNDGDIWISKRLLSTRPKEDWNWVEGDDQRVSWTHLYEYFSKLETSESYGGEDGFVLVSRSPNNLAFMEKAK